MKTLKKISEIFYNFALGIGALFAGFGGLKLFLDWRKERQLKAKIKKLKSLYSRKLLNKKEDGSGFRLIKANVTGNKVFIHVFQENKRHWIMNQSTLHDLDFSSSDEISISDEEMNKIPEGEPIDTTKFNS